MRLQCLALVGMLVWSAGGCRASDAPTLITQFTVTATIPALPTTAKNLRVWIPLPTNSAWQTVRAVRVDAPVPYRITHETRFGNRMVYLTAQRPQTPFVATVQFVVTRKMVAALGVGEAASQGHRQALRAAETLLAPDRNVPIDGRYAKMGAEVAGSQADPLDKMRAIFAHTVATMQYDYRKESPHYAEGDVAWVCDYKKGNCSDLHSYVISLARSQGIPAILEFGFPLTGIPLTEPLPEEGKVGGYHCWTWFHTAKQGWVPLDAADARRWLDAQRPDVEAKLFGGLVLERSAVAISRGRDLVLAPPQTGKPLNYFIYPYAEADGSSVPANWEVHYHRLLTAASPVNGKSPSMAH